MLLYSKEIKFIIKGGIELMSFFLNKGINFYCLYIGDKVMVFLFDVNIN